RNGLQLRFLPQGRAIMRDDLSNDALAKRPCSLGIAWSQSFRYRLLDEADVDIVWLLAGLLAIDALAAIRIGVMRFVHVRDELHVGALADQLAIRRDQIGERGAIVRKKFSVDAAGAGMAEFDPTPV